MQVLSSLLKKIVAGLSSFGYDCNKIVDSFLNLKSVQ